MRNVLAVVLAITSFVLAYKGADAWVWFLLFAWFVAAE